MRIFWLLLVVVILYTLSSHCKAINQPSTNQPLDNVNRTSNTTFNNTSNYGHSKGIHIFVNMFNQVFTPFVICCWILLVSIAKVIFHSVDCLSTTIPDSCLLILLGIPVGFILNVAGIRGHVFLTSELFFQYLLPPIIFDAGYFINTGSFFKNIGTILLYAIIGTIANTFLVGASMYGVAATTSISVSLLHSFLFGALISAVDPVAVLTVFEEVQVNEVLYMLVFGESVLNDAASVVLYRTFEDLPDYFDGEQVGLAIISFFVVSLFGTGIGIIYGLIASFITRFTDHVRVIEPLFVFIMAWMAYLTAEIFHFSGIMSVLFCGVVMKPYVESNISRKSHTTTKYFLKLLASSSEAVIFMFLGVALVQYSHHFNIKFIAWCIFFISIYRAVAIVSLTWLANKFGRLEKVSRIEQVIMSYGGLRGAVAFCLAIVWKVEDGNDELKSLFVTTTLAVIIFTCFVQGATMKKVVEKLGVKKADQREHCIFEHLNDKVLSYTMAGVEELLGVHGHGFWMNIWQIFNRKVLRRCLERNPEIIMDDALFQEERKIEYKHSISQQHLPVIHKEDNSEKISGLNPIALPSDPPYVSTLSTDCVAQRRPSVVVNATDFMQLIPHATRIKPRKRYTDADVGLHGLEYQWDDLHMGNIQRDAYGNKLSEQHRYENVHHHRISLGHHQHHHHHHHRHHGHHGNHGNHESVENHGHHRHLEHNGHNWHHGNHHPNKINDFRMDSIEEENGENDIAMKNRADKGEDLGLSKSVKQDVLANLEIKHESSQEQGCNMNKLTSKTPSEDGIGPSEHAIDASSSIYTNIIIHNPWA